jgi:hypothetical protein
MKSMCVLNVQLEQTPRGAPGVQAMPGKVNTPYHGLRLQSRAVARTLIFSLKVLNPHQYHGIKRVPTLRSSATKHQ